MDGEISPDEVAALLADDADVRVVDIRDETSFERARIPDSENVPFPELAARVEEFAGADRIVTVCPHGKASVQAARLLGTYEGSADATVESMAGGLEAWSERHDLVSGDARAADDHGSSAEAGASAADDGADGPAAPF